MWTLAAARLRYLSSLEICDKGVRRRSVNHATMSTLPRQGSWMAYCDQQRKTLRKRPFRSPSAHWSTSYVKNLQGQANQSDEPQERQFVLCLHVFRRFLATRACLNDSFAPCDPSVNEHRLLLTLLLRSHLMPRMLGQLFLICRTKKQAWSYIKSAMWTNHKL